MTLTAAALLAFILQNASVQGTVVRAANSPLSKATVELRTDEAEGRLIDTITTEADGRFAFQNVRPGRYRIVAARSGYVRPPQMIAVTAGERPRDIELLMSPTGAISGRVFDANGEPLGNVEVMAMKASYPEGRRSLTPVGSVVTNDQGEYRLFWLPPGRYYVSVQPLSDRRRLMAGIMMIGGGAGYFSAATGLRDPALEVLAINERADEQQQLPVYYSGTIDERTATAIDVRAGTDIGGVNLSVVSVREARVRGIVVSSATGRPVQYGTVQADEDGGIERREVRANSENGTFEIKLMPGPHTLNVTSEAGSAYMTLFVTSDIDGLSISVSPDFDVRGRIIVEGTNRGSLDDLRMTLRRDPPPIGPQANRFSTAYSVPLADGTFTLDASSGDFRVNIAPMLNVGFPSRQIPAAWRDAYVKSMRLGDADVLNGVLRLDGPPKAALEIVVGTNPGTLDVKVVNDKLQPVVDASVILVPNVRRRIDLYRTATTDSAGLLRLDRIPPGDYRIFAWAGSDTSDWYDPEFIRKYENRGQAVRIVEGGRVEAQVTLISGF